MGDFLNKQAMELFSTGPWKSVSAQLRLSRFSMALPVVLLVIFVGNVRADLAFVEYSSNQHLELGDNIPEGLDFVAFSMPKFDLAIGDLRGVTLTLVSDFQGGATFYHPTLTLNYTYTPRNYVVADFPDLPSSPILLVDTTLATQTRTAKIWQPTAADISQSSTVIPAQDLAQYAGPGSFQVELTIEDRGVYLASNSLAFINDKFVISDATFTVKYSYAAIPEPATFPIASAIGSLFVIRRRRR